MRKPCGSVLDSISAVSTAPTEKVQQCYLYPSFISFLLSLSFSCISDFVHILEFNTSLHSSSCENHVKRHWGEAKYMFQPTVQENNVSSRMNLFVKHLIKSHSRLNNKKIHASQTRLNKTSITSGSGVLTTIYWHAQRGNIISVTSEMRKSHMSVWLQSIPPPPTLFTTRVDVENKLQVAFNLASKLY